MPICKPSRMVRSLVYALLRSAELSLRHFKVGCRLGVSLFKFHIVLPESWTRHHFGDDGTPDRPTIGGSARACLAVSPRIMSAPKGRTVRLGLRRR